MPWSSRGEGHREDRRRATALAQAGLEVLLVERSRLEEPLQEAVVGLGDQLDQLGPRLVELAGELRRHLLGLRLAVAVAGEAVGLLAHEVDDALEPALGPIGRWIGRASRPKRFQRLRARAEVGALAVHLGQVEDHRQVDLLGELSTPARC
jgi:hypothetical protein